MRGCFENRVSVQLVCELQNGAHHSRRDPKPSFILKLAQKRFDPGNKPHSLCLKKHSEKPNAGQLQRFCSVTARTFIHQYCVCSLFGSERNGCALASMQSFGVLKFGDYSFAINDLNEARKNQSLKTWVNLSQALEFIFHLPGSDDDSEYMLQQKVLFQKAQVQNH